MEKLSFLWWNSDFTSSKLTECKIWRTRISTLDIFPLFLNVKSITIHLASSSNPLATEGQVILIFLTQIRATGDAGISTICIQTNTSWHKIQTVKSPLEGVCSQPQKILDFATWRSSSIRSHIENSRKDNPSAYQLKNLMTEEKVEKVVIRVDQRWQLWKAEKELPPAKFKGRVLFWKNLLKETSPLFWKQFEKTILKNLN